MKKKIGVVVLMAVLLTAVAGSAFAQTRVPFTFNGGGLPIYITSVETNKTWGGLKVSYNAYEACGRVKFHFTASYKRLRGNIETETWTNTEYIITSRTDSTFSFHMPVANAIQLQSIEIWAEKL